MAALLDADLADNAVAEALITKGNQGRAEGRAEGVASSILAILEERGIAVSAAQREKILLCSDADRLNRWLWRAVSAASTDEITAES